MLWDRVVAYSTPIIHIPFRDIPREREKRDGIDITPSNDGADSVAGNIFFLYHHHRRAPAFACVCNSFPPHDFYFARQTKSRLWSNFGTSFLGYILISRCHDIYHLGVLALRTGASGIRFSFLPFFRSVPPSSSRWTKEMSCPRLGACPCI